MNTTDEFYLVLPSNSSMQYYPDNTTTCFTTHLAREMRLSGEWTVGLAEIHIPCTIKHIQEYEAYFLFNPNAQDINENPPLLCSFPQGKYESMWQLANEVNRARDIYKHQMFEPSVTHKGYFALTKKCNCVEKHTTTFNEKICRVFGFENDAQRKNNIIEVSDEAHTVVGSRPAVISRALPEQLFVYTDICVPYTVGDTQASLLRIVSLDTSKYIFGANVVEQFSPVHYLPLLQHNFQSIVIDIRDQHGIPIAFEYGTLTVTLHFKRNRY